MKALIYCELTVRELPNELQFRVDRFMGWFFKTTWPIIFAVLLVLCSAVVFLNEYPPDWSVGIAIGSAINLVLWPLFFVLARRNPTTTLSVTADRFAAAGRGVGSTQWGSAAVEIPISKADWIGFVAGNAPGLYLSRSLSENTCLLPGLDREQARSVTEAIIRRFPDLRSKIEPVRQLTQNPGLAQEPASPRENTRFASQGVVPLQAGSTYMPPVPSTAGLSPSTSNQAQNPSHRSAFGHTELTSRETANGLEFRVDREFGWFMVPLMLAMPVMFLVFSFKIQDTVWRIVFSLITLAFFLWIGFLVSKKWNNIETTTLAVTSQSFVAFGARLKWLKDNATEIVPTNEVTSFGYADGGEDDPSGLYVSSGFWKNKCLLPGLNRQQGTAVAIAIARRFPEIASRMK